LLKRSRGKLFINCATVSPAIHVWVEQKAAKTGAQSLEACMASSITQAREGTLYLMCGGQERRSIAPNRSWKIGRLDALHRSCRQGGAGQGAGQHGHEHQHRRPGRRAGPGRGAGPGPGPCLREVFSQTGANSRVLQTDGEDMQNRDHSCFFSAAHAAKDSGIALRLAKEQGLNLPLATATKSNSTKWCGRIGRLDKSGIAELTFKGRHAPK
jgi:3-hydroxyisobutyrate dehydrogenase